VSALAMMRRVVQICFYKNEYRNKNEKKPLEMYHWGGSM
jgi:hypothetical protein